VFEGGCREVSKQVLPESTFFLWVMAEPFIGLWSHRQLVQRLVEREVLGRYRGSVGGVAWSLLNPLLMLAVYTFVFTVVFKARWGTNGDSQPGLAIFLFAGLIMHSLFAECVNRAPGLILSNVSYVKKVVFPLEILPWVAMGSALFHAGVSLLVLLGAMLLLGNNIPATVVFLPLVILPLILGTMGLAWFLAATGVFVRDIGQVTGVATTVLLFLSPVLYPLTFIIEQTRGVLIAGQPLDLAGWSVQLALAILIACVGHWWFQRTRKGFADVL
jgi:lipopolysaccharide transport system permease protein